jgi:hypothetical protein
VKRYFFLILISILSSVQAQADGDAAQDARDAAQEKAQQEAAQRERDQIEQEKKNIQNQINAEYNKDAMASKRKMLGSAATGKSDAEVNSLYDAKLKEATQTAQSAQKALSGGQGAAAVKQVTGKSMSEMENMSDEELEALAKEMEEKYGN